MATPIDPKSTKDLWDILDIIFKGLLPVAVGLAGWWIQAVLSAQSTGKDYVQMALNILQSAEPHKNQELRKWAMDILQSYSPVKLDNATADLLVNGKVNIPLMSEDSRKPIWEEAIKNPYDPLIRRAGHGGPWAKVTTDGALSVQGRVDFKDQTGITSPKEVVFSVDGDELIVYNDEAFSLYFTQPDINQGKERIHPPIRGVSPPHGIASIAFSDWQAEISAGEKDPKKMIIVTGTDGERIQYDLDGNEIK